MLAKLHLDLYQWSTLNQVMLMKGLTASRDILLEDLRKLSMGIGHANDWTEITFEMDSFGYNPSADMDIEDVVSVAITLRGTEALLRSSSTYGTFYLVMHS